MTAHSFPFARAMPVLEVADLTRSLAFYTVKLGFSAETWGEPPSFAIVQRGTVTIALACVAPGTVAASRQTWAAYVYVRDADDLFAELTALGVAIPHAPETKPYGCREILVDDPDGHMIAFGQVLDPDSDPLGPGLSNRFGRDALLASPVSTAISTAGPWSGGCQCGAVRFRAAALGRASICHCRMCQKAYGSVGGLLVTARDLAWTRGQPKRFRSSNKVERGFCADCGTPITFEYDGKLDVSIATLDRAREIMPAVQMARGERLPFVDAIAAIPVRPDEAAWRANWVDTITSYQHPDHDTEAWGNGAPRP